MFERPEGGEHAGLIQVGFRMPATAGEIEEFHNLALSAGAEILYEDCVVLDKPEAGFLIGEGKVAEIAAKVAELNLNLVIFNAQLSPSQERNLEKALQVRVLDRNGLVLDIFAQRARSYEGKLQVELAQLKHLSTRLVRGWTHLERQKGGIGLRGPGETQLETDRRLIGVRIRQLQRKLEKVRKQREQNRLGRQRRDIPVVALAGYTNSGKSTLFNRLTGADVYAKDQLFATLDPTWRKLKYDGRQDIVLSDTVGFISDLPHELVEAFHATLQESSAADLLIHVVDYADEYREEHVETVNQVLKEIHAADLPCIMVWNKIDLLAEKARLQRDEDGNVRAVWLSAKTGEGVSLLVQAIVEYFHAQMCHGWLSLPPSDGQIRAAFYNEQAVEKEYYTAEGGVFLLVHIRKKRLEQLKCQYNRDLRLSESLDGNVLL